jgi:hypothetical protein
MSLATAKAVANLILKYGPAVMDAGRTLGTWKKKKDIPAPDLPARISRLEEFVGLQAKLNEQLVEELQALRPALARIDRSLKLLFSFVILAVSLSLFALGTMISK